MAVLLTKEQVADVRQKIREVAERHIARDGPHGASMRAIAAEIGWTAASLYRYYASKAELLDATRAAAYERFSDCIEAAGNSGEDLWDKSRAIGDAYADFAFREPAAYQLIFAFEQAETDKSAELRAAQARAGDLMTRYVREMVDAGLLEGEPAEIAHAYWAVLHGLVVLQMAGKLDPALPFDTLRHSAARLITRGARASGPGHAARRSSAP